MKRLVLVFLILFSFSVKGLCDSAKTNESDQCPAVCDNMEHCRSKDNAHACYHQCGQSKAEGCIKYYASHHVEIPHLLNTSNQGKLAEFKRLFEKYQHDMANTSFDLAEIDAEALLVIVHKASAVNDMKGGVLVEDTSLDIEGEEVGVNIRWLLSNLDKYEGKKATWTVMLAFREGDLVFVSTGVVEGKIVKPTGDAGFGFDPFFLPEGHKQTLAESKPDEVNARAKAVEHIMNRQFIAIEPAIDAWEGKWQDAEH